MIKQSVAQPPQKNIIKIIFWNMVTYLKIATIVRLFISKDSYLIDQGWFLSVKKNKSVDKNGKLLPWLTYPFINFIEPRLNKTLSMFEYGSGSSTIWFAERVGEIHSVEHNKAWYNEISQHKPANAKITLREINTSKNYSEITFMSIADTVNYSTEVRNSKILYDIILIDGVYRNNSVANSVESLKMAGVIIIDNVDYIESNQSTDYLTNLGFKRIDFWGMCPIVFHDSCTAIFYRDNNCLNI